MPARGTKSPENRRMSNDFRSFVSQGKSLDDYQQRLSSAWLAILNGNGSKEDADLAMGDLVSFSGLYTVTPEGTPSELLQRLEGRKEFILRILFLCDVPSSYMNDLRRASLDELQITGSE